MLWKREQEVCSHFYIMIRHLELGPYPSTGLHENIQFSIPLLSSYLIKLLFRDFVVQSSGMT
jgi:hypothetical protein